MTTLNNIAIRFGGDICYNYDTTDLRPIHSLVFSTIDRLPRRVLLTVDCYVHTVNSEIRLDKISCLHSLRVCIIKKPQHGGFKIFNSFDGDPSHDICQIIRQNSDLKHLHLCFKCGFRRVHNLHDETRVYALERIGQAVSHLESLALEGVFNFTNDGMEYKI